ncbi:Peroxisome biogenesis protein 22 [Platanthera guangdongensis]|uniref:Peroxisome biogenesis protein 22 n=1 Tax=Platanthera guangdongensis TaxID=2320717 RepID=A0ABR2LS46_9ASPA
MRMFPKMAAEDDVLIQSPRSTTLTLVGEEILVVVGCGIPAGEGRRGDLVGWRFLLDGGVASATGKEKMSDLVEDDAVSFLRRAVVKQLNKFTDVVLQLLNHKRAGSVGAIAGLAIAVVFTWKFLKSPPGRERRNPPKRRGFPPANGDFSGGAASAAQDSSAAPIWGDSDAIQENGSPYEVA